MFTNYFKTAWRNILRSKGFSFINIFGLAIGMVSAALIFLWAEYQFQYNRQLPGSDNIYQVKNNQFYGEDIKTMSSTSGPLAQAMYKEIPGFDKVVRTLQAGGVFAAGEKFLSKDGVYADSSYFGIFQFPVVEKIPDFSLANPTQIAISKKMAESFFDKQSALGKTISLNKKDAFTVGMVYDIPSENMTARPDFVLPMNQFMADSNHAKNWSHWGQCGIRTYATVAANTSVANINGQLKNFIRNKTNNDTKHEVFLYPYTKLGLYNSFKNGVEDPSDGMIKYVKMFITIAIVILLIACINFMNLSTARSEKRAKEIGLKKVVGATRPQIMRQFLLESVLMSMLALVLAILLLTICVPFFGRLVELPLALNLWQPSHLFALLLTGLLCGLLAGSYPGIYLSSFNPINALKKQVANRSDVAGLVRKGLVVLQFAASIILIVATIVIYGQINHARHRDLGFRQENIIQFYPSETLAQKFDVLRQRLLQSGQVSDVAMANGSMFSLYSNGSGFNWAGSESKQDALITFMLVTPGYLKMMNIGLESGRDFYDDVKSDSNHVIINHTMAELMGNEGKAGKILYRGQGDGREAQNIIGVTRPFVINEIYGDSPPTLIMSSTPETIMNWGGDFFVKLKPGQDIHSKIKLIETEVKNIDNSVPFQYHFLDEGFDALFKSERFIGYLALLFGSLAIFISCLGLLGLSAYMAEQRKKEIGVRKVVGASVFSITSLLSKDFLKLVGVAIMIAIPVAWYFMNGWLQSYTYRIGLTWWVFALAALIAVLIALFTVSFQAIKAAMGNPVKSLRTE